MESKPRQMLVAMGLFVGGVTLGSTPGFGARETSTAHAAMTEPRPELLPRPKPERGGLSAALRAAPGAGRDENSGIEPMDWGGRCTLRSGSGSDREGSHAVSRGPSRSGDREGSRGNTFTSSDDDPLSGLKLPSLPVTRHPHVLKYVRWFTESREGRKTFLDAFKRSGRFSEVIAKSLRELGLPNELIAVAFVESGFSPVAVSTAGATGLWQFMPQTARAYGLVVESNYDERASIWRSSSAAARHLGDLYEHFRSWELALAAYNLGYDGLDRRLDEYETEDFWTLAETPGALPKETAHYVPKVLATAIVLANLEEFGFADVERSPAIDGSELEVPGGTRLAMVARAAGTSVRALKDMNPELLSEIVPDRGEGVTLHVPRSGLARARVMLTKLISEDDDADDNVSADFDWGKDDVREGRGALERTGRGHRGGTSPLAGTRRRSRRSSISHGTDADKAKTSDDETSESNATSASANTGTGTQRVRSARTTKGANEARETHDAVTGKAASKGGEARETASAREASTESRDGRDGRSERRAASPKSVYYRVSAGDSIKGIAMTFGLTVDEVVAQAGVVSPEQIKAGTLLELRVSPNALGDIRRGKVD